MATAATKGKYPKVPDSINAKNLMKIKFGYGCNVVLPIEDGVTIIESLKRAESVDNNNYEMPKVIPFKEDIEIHIISEHQYKIMKSNALLEPEST